MSLPTRVRQIVRTAAERQGVTVADVLHGGQQAELVAARSESIVALRRLKFSLPTIGRFLQLHHTTVFHHLKKAGLTEAPAYDPTQPDESGIWAI